MKQLQFDKIPRRKTFFGGSLLKQSHAKSARPLSTKLPIHLVLKSSKAKGVYSFLNPRNTKRVKLLLQKVSKMFEIQILEFSINGNHLHLLIRGHKRDDIKNFMRTLSALISRFVQNRHKVRTRCVANSRYVKSQQSPSQIKDFRIVTDGKQEIESFWDQRPFTRIVEGHRGYIVTKDYVVLNHLEALGIVPFKPRKSYYSSA